MFKERCVQLTYLEELLNRDVFLMCHNRQNENAMIDGTMIDVLRRTIRFSKRHKKVALIIQTPGGSANETFYICKFFREYYDAVDTYIVGDCYSGGTIIALSSDNIYMNRNACLGPIDLQLSYNEKKPWSPELYGMINALNKGLKNDDITPELVKLMKDKPEILAMYFKNLYSYKNIVGDYVRKHCKDEEKWEEVYTYLAELNFSHGSSLTYKRCVELGLDVKRMPKKLDEIISKIVRDVEEEFGGLVSKSIFYDFYESNEGNIIKRANILSEEDGMGKIEMVVSKASEKLAIIETSQSGYIQEAEFAITLYGVIPMYITPIKEGWKEEYNTLLVLPEQNKMFEEYIDDAVQVILETTGLTGVDIPMESYVRMRNFVKTSCYDGVLAILKEEEDMDIDSMSSSQKWKAVVEYCLEERRQFDEEQDRLFMASVEPFIRKYADEQKKDYDSLTKEEKEDLLGELMDSCIPKVVKKLGVTLVEFEKLPEDEQDEMIIDYLFTYEYEDCQKYMESNETCS